MFKKQLTIFLVLILLFSFPAYSSEHIPKYNALDVYLNDKLILQSGQDTENNGTVVPSSILYKGTTYLPLKLISEHLGLTVSWNGRVYLATPKQSSVGINTVYSQHYSYPLNIKGIFPDYKVFYVEDSLGNVLDIDVKRTQEGISITDSYKLSPKGSYTLNSVHNGTVYSDKLILSGITLSSFKSTYNAWELLVPADSSKGYSFPFIIRVPKKSGDIQQDILTTSSTLLAEGNNEFLTTSNEESVQKVLKDYPGWYSSQLGRLGNYISIMSIFPRPWEDPILYTHSLDRDTLFKTKEYLNGLGRGDLYRIDKQFDAMLSESIRLLRSFSKEVNDKVFLVGFSASSDFATRFNYTHPDRAKAIVVNAAPTLPLTEYNGFPLKFPLGMSDISLLTGSPFDVDKYKSVPQFWHTGDRDTNDGTYFTDGWGNYGDSRNNQNQEGIDYRRLFGDEIVARKALIEKILVEKGFTNITFKTYTGVEHGWNATIIKDALNFLKKYE